MTRQPLIVLTSAAATLVVGFALGRLSGPAPVEADTPQDTADVEAALPPSTDDRFDPAAAVAMPETASEPGKSVERSAVPTGAAASAVSEDGAETSPMMAELNALLASGRIQEVLGQDESKLRKFLFGRYLQVGDFDAAQALLENTESSSGEWGQLAKAMLDAGDPAGARVAYERAIDTVLAGVAEREGRVRWNDRRELQQFARSMLKIDPDAAVALVERLQLENPDMELFDDFDAARFLIEAGRSDEAFALYDEAMAQEFMWGETLDAMVSADPEAAEEYLRNFMEANGADPRLQAALAESLVGQERHDEALDLIDEVMLSGDQRGINLLESVFYDLPSEVVAERIDGWIASSDGMRMDDTAIGMLSNAMEFYVEAGRVGEAVDIQQRIFESIADGDSVPGWLPTVSSEVLRNNAGYFEPSVRRIESRAGSNDELWGDIGDTYWSMGLEEEAKRCWIRANEFDPSDGEWTSNLRALYEGRSPR